MVKEFAALGLVSSLGVLPASLGAANRKRLLRACTGRRRRPPVETRREQALALAEQINRAEDPGPGGCSAHGTDESSARTTARSGDTCRI